MFDTGNKPAWLLPLATLIFPGVCYAFLQTYPTLSQAQALTFEQLKIFLRQHHHTQVRSWPTIYAGLHVDHPVSNPDLDAAYAPLAVAQAKILETLIRSRQACLTRLDKLFVVDPRIWRVF